MTDQVLLAPDPKLDANWWRQAVVYQVYPRSFADSDGDGLGDIPGVTSRMGYLADLGVDAVWLSPFYPSALADGGYDVADYRNVAPELGTLDDFDAMVAGSKEQFAPEDAPRLIAFASLSMPAMSLKAMIVDVSRAGGVVVFRGMPGNSARTFTTALAKVLPQGEVRAAVGVDPLAP